MAAGQGHGAAAKAWPHHLLKLKPPQIPNKTRGTINSGKESVLGTLPLFDDGRPFQKNILSMYHMYVFYSIL